MSPERQAIEDVLADLPVAEKLAAPGWQFVDDRSARIDFEPSRGRGHHG